MNDKKLSMLYRDRVISILDKAIADGAPPKDIAACIVHVGLEMVQYNEILQAKIASIAKAVVAEHTRDLH